MNYFIEVNNGSPWGACAEALRVAAGCKHYLKNEVAEAEYLVVFDEATDDWSGRMFWGDLNIEEYRRDPDFTEVFVSMENV